MELINFLPLIWIEDFHWLLLLWEWVQRNIFKWWISITVRVNSFWIDVDCFIYLLNAVKIIRKDSSSWWQSKTTWMIILLKRFLWGLNSKSWLECLPCFQSISVVIWQFLVWHIWCVGLRNFIGIAWSCLHFRFWAVSLALAVLGSLLNRILVNLELIISGLNNPLLGRHFSVGLLSFVFVKYMLVRLLQEFGIVAVLDLAIFQLDQCALGVIFKCWVVHSPLSFHVDH